MFPHFDRRLQRDIKGIVDRRLEASESASGRHMKVSCAYTLGFYWTFCLSAVTQFGHVADGDNLFASPSSILSKISSPLVLTSMSSLTSDSILQSGPVVPFWQRT